VLTITYRPAPPRASGLVFAAWHLFSGIDGDEDGVEGEAAEFADEDEGTGVGAAPAEDFPGRDGGVEDRDEAGGERPEDVGAGGLAEGDAAVGKHANEGLERRWHEGDYSTDVLGIFRLHGLRM
jgi:hypothetical protein